MALLLLAIGCSRSPTAPSATNANAASTQKTILSFTSDAQDYVGMGQSRSYTLQNAAFEPHVFLSGAFVTIVIRSNDPTPEFWQISAIAPTGRRLAPGSFDTSRVPTSTTPVFGLGGQGRACDPIGHVVIHAVAFSADLASLQNLRASFEQHCDGASPALRGEIAVLADPWR